MLVLDRTKPVTVEALVRFARARSMQGELSVSVAELAKFVGCHHPSIRNWLTGSRARANVAALCAALNLRDVRVETRARLGTFVTFVPAA